MKRYLMAMCFAALALGTVFAQESRPVPQPPTEAESKEAAEPNPNSGDPVAIIETSAGIMTCTLFPGKAPVGVANFIGLATGVKDWRNPADGTNKHGVPLYDGTIFHRVIPNFMVQGGDPKGDGTGDPGYRFKNEVSSDLLFDKPGRLAYANSGPDTNGSQFFITEVATPTLNGNYTIFGQCDDATVSLVRGIAHMDADPRNDRPFRPVKINRISIRTTKAIVEADEVPCNALDVVRIDDAMPSGTGHCAGEADFWFTNTSAQAIDCAIIFHKNGRFDAGSVVTFTLLPGEKQGGTGNISTCGADSGQMQYQCFPHAESTTRHRCTAQIQWRQ
jgi:peptidyl-prolyl cis-trans isomerase A (cyclophilin A)